MDRRPPSLVIAVIVILLTTSVGIVGWYVLLLGTGKIERQVVRLVLTGVLSVFLYRGAGWACSAARFFLVAVGVVSAVTALLKGGGGLGLVFLPLGIVYLWCASVLGRPDVKAFFGAPSDLESEDEEDDGDFVYILIPEPLGGLERGDKYEDPLQEMLEREGLGEVAGGGSQLGDELEDGSPSIELCGVDLSVTDLERARAFLREELVRLGAPSGTQIHFTLDRDKLQDVLLDDGWGLHKAREWMHPAFE